MPWLKDVLIDLAVTVLIVLLALQGWEWAAWVVWIYTPLMVLVKVASLFVGRLMETVRNDVPAWFFHLLYGLNVVVLAVDGRWILALFWVVIWSLSVVAERRARPVA